MADPAPPLNAYEMFNKDADERGVPLSGNPGAAAEWTEPGEQPRPDKSIDGLKWRVWLGFLGLDHFYLRSPFTGLAKLFTLSGFGIWYIWDILQVYTESDRVVKFGLSLPFDFGQGVAQGMIVEGDPEYAQRAPFSGWQLASLFGFIGIDSFLLGRIGQGARKITEFIFLMIGIASIFIAWNESGVTGLLTFGKIVIILMVIFFGGIVFTNWSLSLSTIFTRPAKLFERGITVSPTMDKALNSYTSFLRIFSDESKQQIKKDMNYGSVDGAEFKKRFEIVTKDTLEKEKDSVVTGEDSDAKWLISYFKWLFLIPAFIFQLIVSLVKLGITFVAPWLRIANAEADATVAGIEKAEAAAAAAANAAAGTAHGAAASAVQTAAANPLAAVAANPLAAAASAVQSAHGAAAGAVQSAHGAAAGAAHTAHAAAAGAAQSAHAAAPHGKHIGGARRTSELSTEAKVLGAAVIAIVGGGALKAIVDSLVSQ